MSYRTSQSGFTMVEILVVIGIIGILSTVGLGAYTISQQKGRDAARKSNLAQIARALEVYANDFGQYPADDSNGNIMGCGADGAQICVWDGDHAFETGGNLNQSYMKVLPTDPKTGMSYFYNTINRKDYYLCSTLEVPANIDKAYIADLSSECTCGSADCHYKLTDAGVEMP